MRRMWAGPAAVLLATGCAAGGPGAAAGCVGPELVALTPDRGSASTSVEMTVEWLREGCNDHTGADEERPSEDVPVYFSQQDGETLVGTMTGAGERYRDTLRFQVPATATPGPAELYLGTVVVPIATFTVG